jgi:uncharacterized protein DUF3306
VSSENFLSRWSRRKSASKATSEAGHAVPSADVVPAQAGIQSQETALAKSETQPPEPLPPVESLTFDSDFTGFMKPDVDPALRREALKTLLKDPRFNVMDGLDVYIDDYSKPDPLPEGWLEKLNQVKHLGHYIAPEETAQAASAPAEEDTRKAVAEQPVEPPPAVEGPDTSSTQISPSQVGKSPVPREGDPDVLV